jgi:hypothetical protein
MYQKIQKHRIPLSSTVPANRYLGVFGAYISDPHNQILAITTESGDNAYP